mmetsp:Transcript_19314/g.56203  ORF Transcript_19314/g.56203 Transcript_19314/m.56203 type:complete len:102 (+) Transcript_19314:1180-1485(+)
MQSHLTTQTCAMEGNKSPWSKALPTCLWPPSQHSRCTLLKLSSTVLLHPCEDDLAESDNNAPYFRIVSKQCVASKQGSTPRPTNVRTRGEGRSGEKVRLLY